MILFQVTKWKMLEWFLDGVFNRFKNNFSNIIDIKIKVGDKFKAIKECYLDCDGKRMRVIFIDCGVININMENGIIEFRYFSGMGVEREGDLSPETYVGGGVGVVYLRNGDYGDWKDYKVEFVGDYRNI